MFQVIKFKQFIIIQLQFILVLSKSKIVDSTYKLVILKIHHTVVMFDRVLSVRHKAFVHAHENLNNKSIDEKVLLFSVLYIFKIWI